jgi:hypothetical protein
MNTPGNTHHPGPADSLLAGCQSYPAAIGKAEQMIQAWRHTGDDDAQGRDTEFWDSATAQTLGCYLHAAALSGLPASSAAAWLAGPAHSATAAEILATHPGASRQAADSLRSMLNPRPSKTAQTIRYLAAEVFAHAAGHRLG